MANLLNCLRLSLCSPIRLAAYRELPGDTGNLVGQRHRNQLRVFPLEEFDEPSGSMFASTCSDVLKKSGRANHQYAS